MPCGERYCSPECRDTGLRLKARNLSFTGATPVPEAPPEPVERPDPIVLYGLLTVSDVCELERRRALFAARVTERGAA
jgi:hypothetical protein